jgi:signal transduction histidine kinase
MLGKIEELIGGIRDISANVAHDLRTPLNRLRHRLENVTLLGLSPTDTREEIRLAVEEVDRLVATFNAILRISQAETGAGFDRFEPFSLSMMVEDVAELYDALAEARQIRLQTSLAAEIQYHGDKHLLTQAFANLLDNAIKYSPADSEVNVTLHQEGESILLTVADHGAGIPPEYYGKVTQKFFRMEASRTTSGNGLGLSLALAAIKLHGGTLQFEENHPGLKVTVRLPV